MWKVKRMNKPRIVVLAIAIGAGGVAAYLASGSDKPAPTQPVVQMQTVDVLVAKSDIGLGQSVKPDDLQWQTWPAATASNNFISRASKADAVKEITGSIARSPFVAGEPIREQKLVRADGSGFMAAILPAGFRAISTEISPETGAGGFILPNDRVDVILIRSQKGNQNEAFASETILTNVRVLAIDQTVEEKNGQRVVVGKVATLALNARDSETLALASRQGTLSLVLRSLADAKSDDSDEANRNASARDSINVIRFGQSLPK